MNASTSVRNVNLLYVVAFLAVFVGSLVMPPVSLGWRVIINELAFLALPLALYLLLTREDLRDALRLRPVSWPVAWLSLVVGLAVWHVDGWLGMVINQALDYVIPLSPELLSVTLLDNVALIVGAVVLAPIVEELLFRGVLQSAYERRGPVRAIAASSLLFVVFHQEFAQSIALLPVAVALGYVTWRTQSIIPAMLIHAGNNGQAVLVSFLAEGSARPVTFEPSMVLALVGLVIAVGALWLLTRRTAAPQRERAAAEPGWSVGRWLARSWPILPVVPIYPLVVGLGLLVGAWPEALALGQQLELGAAPWEGETRWSYEVWNALDEPVGQAECSLTPESGAFALDCSMEQSAYEADAPTGFFKEGEVTQRQMVRWDVDTLALEGARFESVFAAGPEEVEIGALFGEGRLSVDVDGVTEGGERFERCYLLPDGEEGAPSSEEPCRVDHAFLAGGGSSSPLMVGEWPWRFSALPFEVAYSRKVTLLWPYRSVTGVDEPAPAKEDVFVVVRTAEQLSTPAGEFVTWRVTVGERQTAWYTVDPPHHLVAYSDDMVSWQLTDIE